eukprot:gene18706-25229_t
MLLSPSYRGPGNMEMDQAVSQPMAVDRPQDGAKLMAVHRTQDEAKPVINAFALMMKASQSAKSSQAAKPSQSAQPSQAAKSSKGTCGDGPGASMVVKAAKTGMASVAGGSWTGVLKRFAADPERHLGEMEEPWFDEQCVRLVDKFPKSLHHCLVVARDPTLVSVEDLKPSHVVFIKHMQEVAPSCMADRATAAAQPFSPALPPTTLRFPKSLHHCLVVARDPTLMFPKSLHHCLVVARDPTLVSVEDLKPSHVDLLAHMREVASSWIAEKQQLALSQGRSLPPFKLGFHQVGIG